MTYDDYAEIMKSAKSHLRGNGNDGVIFICSAVYKATGADLEIALVITKWIERMLDGFVCYDDWLRHKNPGVNFDSREIQSYRHQWIDSLINYLENQHQKI